jgi:hypothetical protein
VNLSRQPIAAAVRRGIGQYDIGKTWTDYPWHTGNAFTDLWRITAVKSFGLTAGSSSPANTLKPQEQDEGERR